MNPPPDEAQWILGLSSDAEPVRRAALDDIYRAYGAGLLGLCLRVTCCQSDAEDALQETFVQLLRYGQSFRGDSSLRTWVTRIAIRSALAIKSKHTRRRNTELTEDRHDLSAGPAERAADNEGASRLLAAISKLPAEQRIVLGLAAFDGLKGVDIAEVLGIPEGTVYSRLHTAREKLRQLL
jgi:RNA polymerase sigma-70 factor (ECF subfamily)